MSKYGTWTRGEDEALLNILGGDEVARAILRGEKQVVVKTPDLLCKIAVAQVPAVQRFVCNDQALKEANVGWTSDKFKEVFLGLVEENVEAATLAVSRLEKGSKDAPIMTELGDRAQTKLAHFLELLKEQSKGQSGKLLTNGYANIAYVVGNDGNLWAVSAGWGSGDRDWYLYADSVESPHEGDAGRQVVSCDS